MKKFLVSSNCDLKIALVNQELWIIMTPVQKKIDLKIATAQKPLAKVFAGLVRILSEAQKDTFEIQDVTQLKADAIEII